MASHVAAAERWGKSTANIVTSSLCASATRTRWSSSVVDTVWPRSCTSLDKDPKVTPDAPPNTDPWWRTQKPTQFVCYCCFTSRQHHIRVTMSTHCDFIMPLHWEIRLPAP